MNKLIYPPSSDAHLVFVLPAPYIVEEFVMSILRTGDWASVTFYINTKSMSHKFLSHLYSLSGSTNAVYLHEIATFELKGALSHRTLICNLKNCLKSSSTSVYLFIQSLDQAFCRYLVNLYVKYTADIYIVGLQFSLPVFLFRDPEYISKLVSNKELKEFFFQRAKKLKNINKSGFDPLFLKKLVLKITEYLLDLFFLDKKFRTNRMVTATSYVRRDVIDLHLAGKDYYKFCLEQIYNEPVELIEAKPLSDNHIELNLEGLGTKTDLIILGPVSQSMVDFYLTDVNFLTANGYHFSNIHVKPHPRFRSLADSLICSLKAQLLARAPIVLGVVEEIPQNAISSVVLGYYSSLFDELLSAHYKGMCVISEGATHCRYPNLPVGVLSGEKFGFGNPQLVLGRDGVLTKSSEYAL